jgi:cytochrome d ubiquinol oxidase subunit II
MSPLVLWVGALIHVCLVLYTLLGGADLGAGFWDLAATGPRADDQRRLIERSLQGTWELNHLMLAALVGLLFFGFPAAYYAIGTALFLPLALGLLAFVVRGTAFVFRRFDAGLANSWSVWSRIFGLSSAVAPFALGVCLGATASGRIRHGLDAPRPTLTDAWLLPFPLATGLLVLSVCAFLSAAYLTMEADDDALREAFRRRALAAAVAVTISAWLTFFTAWTGAPHLVDGLWRSWWAMPFQLATSGIGVALLAALVRRRYALARALAVVQVAALVSGFNAAQLPYLVPPDLTLASAAASDDVLRAVAIVLTTVLALLGPAYAWLLGALTAARDG